jgi:hypothetical protein
MKLDELNWICPTWEKDTFVSASSPFVSDYPVTKLKDLMKGMLLLNNY